MVEADCMTAADEIRSGPSEKSELGPTQALYAAEIEQLFRRHFSELRTVINWRCRDMELAGEIAQATMEIVARRWAVIRDHPNCFFCVRKIAFDILVDYYRQADARRRLAGRLAEHAPAASDQRIEEVESDAVVDALLDQLPDRQRDVMRRRLRGDTELEIAGDLGITGGAVKQHLSRAKVRLRSLWNQTGTSQEGGARDA
jgi:RNA polymerase sigma factor (sigma-70 family)